MYEIDDKSPPGDPQTVSAPLTQPANPGGVLPSPVGDLPNGDSTGSNPPIEVVAPQEKVPTTAETAKAEDDPKLPAGRPNQSHGEEPSREKRPAGGNSNSATPAAAAPPVSSVKGTPNSNTMGEHAKEQSCNQRHKTLAANRRSLSTCRKMTPDEANSQAAAERDVEKIMRRLLELGVIKETPPGEDHACCVEVAREQAEAREVEKEQNRLRDNKAAQEEAAKTLVGVQKELQGVLWSKKRKLKLAVDHIRKVVDHIDDYLDS